MMPDFLIEKIDADRLKDFKIRLQYFARGLQVYIRQLRVALQGKTGEALKTEENKIKVAALKITNNINILIKDLFHNPPSYKSTVTLSWKPVQKEAAAVGQKREWGDDGTATSVKKIAAPVLPRRDARQIYNPPSGKYSGTIGNFPYEQRGGFPGGTHGRSTTLPAANTAVLSATSHTSSVEVSEEAGDGASEEGGTGAEGGSTESRVKDCLSVTTL